MHQVTQGWVNQLLLSRFSIVAGWIICALLFAGCAGEPQIKFNPSDSSVAATHRPLPASAPRAIQAAEKATQA